MERMELDDLLERLNEVEIDGKAGLEGNDIGGPALEIGNFGSDRGGSEYRAGSGSGSGGIRSGIRNRQGGSGSGMYGSGSGAGNSGSGAGNSGSGAGNSGSDMYGSGSGAGNSGSGAGNSGSGAGNSGSDMYGSGSGAGNSGSGAGNSGSGAGNSGSDMYGSGSGAGNSGSGAGNSGSGAGNSGSDMYGSGSGAGNSGSGAGYSGSGTGNSGSGVDGSGSGTGNSGSGAGNSGSGVDGSGSGSGNSGSGMGGSGNGAGNPGSESGEAGSGSGSGEEEQEGGSDVFCKHLGGMGMNGVVSPITMIDINSYMADVQSGTSRAVQEVETAIIATGLVSRANPAEALMQMVKTFAAGTALHTTAFIQTLVNGIGSALGKIVQQGIYGFKDTLQCQTLAVRWVAFFAYAQTTNMSRAEVLNHLREHTVQRMFVKSLLDDLLCLKGDLARVAADIDAFKSLNANDTSRAVAIQAFSYLYDAAKVSRDYQRILCVGQRLAQLLQRITQVPITNEEEDTDIESQLEEKEHILLSLFEKALQL